MSSCNPHPLNEEWSDIDQFDSAPAFSYQPVIAEPAPTVDSAMSTANSTFSNAQVAFSTATCSFSTAPTASSAHDADAGLRLLTHSEDEIVRNIIRTDGEFSSDGEFSAIAQREAQTLGVNSIDDIKVEFQQEDGHQQMTEQVALPFPLQVQFSPNSATGADPCKENYPGELGFDLRVLPPVKSKDAHYSPKLDKLFINQNRAVEIFFKFEAGANLPEGLYVRGVVVYTRPDDAREPVKVCPSHAKDSTGALKSFNSEHLMHCRSPHATYYCDQVSQRHSVLTPLPQLQPGSNEISMKYIFYDLGSCPGGINRRDTAIIYTLEFGNEVIGRKTLPLRICTCPKRDMKTEEESDKRSSIDQITVGHGKIKIETNKEKEYWVLARGQQNFEDLKSIGRMFEKRRSGSDNLREYDEAVNKFNSHKRKKVEEHQNRN